MGWCGFATGVVCFFLDSSLYSVPSRVQRTFSLDSFTYMNASVSALINLRVTPSCVSLVHQHTSRMQHPSERMINEMEASSASLGSPFRPILTPPSAHWHLRDSTSNERQQPTSEIILRPGTVCAEWHWLSHTFTQTHTHTCQWEKMKKEVGSLGRVWKSSAWMRLSVFENASAGRVDWSGTVGAGREAGCVLCERQDGRWEGGKC